MSQTIYDLNLFNLAANSTMTLHVAFNGNLTRGGDNMGAVVVAAATQRLKTVIDVSTTSMIIISRDRGHLTSRTLYRFKVTNNNSFHVTFSVEYFCDD